MGCGYSKENQLYEAVRKGDAKHVHKLLKAGISHTGSVDSVGSTLLHVAGQLGHAGVIDELCEVSSLVFIEKKNAHGFTALHEAAITGNVKAIQV
jgi:ankyrin repeat protein